MKISKILNGYITVSYIDDDSVVLAKRGKIYIYNFFSKKLSFILSLPENALFYYLFSSKLLFRLFRYGVRCGITISNNELFLVFRKRIDWFTVSFPYLIKDAKLFIFSRIS